MSATLSRWNTAVRTLLCRLGGVEPPPPPVDEDAARQRFDREYEAILSEMAASLPALSGCERELLQAPDDPVRSEFDREYDPSFVPAAAQERQP